MRIGRYRRSLRIRITLVITSLALISAIIYSVFSWFIFDISDDRLFNWHVVSISEQAVNEKRLPKESFNSFSLIGDDEALLNQIAKRYPYLIKDKHPQNISDIFEISNIAHYPSGHKILDVDNRENQLELQIVISPWENEWLYVVYNVSEFETSQGPTNLDSDKFALYVLIPLAILMGVLAIFSSIGLTQTILRPLTNLANQVTSVNPEQLSTQLTDQFYPDEVGELADTFNILIERVGQYIENEKRFSREVSHELRTPTTSLSIALELFETTTLDKRQKQLLARMQRANLDMTQLINTFIWLAKNIPENAPKEKIVLFTCIEEVLTKLAYLNTNRPVTIANKVDELQILTVNTVLLKIVLNNLLRNALQYTQQGSIEVTSSVNSLTITDTGLGIPLDEIENIKQAFYSLQPDGIGLGMSIVQRITKSLGWQLLIKSEEQKGTEITIVFATD
ncbi:MAG: HAMP domain-containing histidine kinase [Kangiellaceae bacterium]|nr:HAMP domain-containing histidine kinase [Kangiellaceae bacterium]